MDVKATLAELIGTFTLVFIGAGAGAVLEPNSAGTVGVALAHGLALMVIVYAWGSISGAACQPGRDVGIAIAGQMEWRKAISYWIAQFLAPRRPPICCSGSSDQHSNLGSTIGSLTPLAGVEGDAAESHRAGGDFDFLPGGRRVCLGHPWSQRQHGRHCDRPGADDGYSDGRRLTGASMNPARTFGPALATGDLSYLWMYFVGPLAGGALAALLYDQIFLARGAEASGRGGRHRAANAGDNIHHDVRNQDS